MKGTPNGDQSDTPKPHDIQGLLEPIGRKDLEWKIDCFLFRECGEMRTVGLPWAPIVRRAEVNRVLLAIPPNAEAHPGEIGGFERTPRGSQVECRLDETTVVLETDIAAEVQAGTAIDNLVSDGCLRDPTHHLVADRIPSRAQVRDEIVPGKIVDQHVIHLIIA